MRRLNFKTMLYMGAIALASASTLVGATARAQGDAAQPFWVSAYYAVWSQRDGILDPSEIDFSAITHLIHFAIMPNADGSIDTDAKGDYITPEQSAAVVTAAHAAQRLVLLCVGGHAGSDAFHAAVNDPTARVALENNLVNLVVDRGYDGLDIDFEPLNRADIPDFEIFVRDMRTKLTAAKPGLLMTAAAGQQPQEYAHLQSMFDQINLMTYDLSGRWIGPHTWFNSCLQDGGNRMLKPGVPYPSVTGRLDLFLKAGVDPKKLGIGTAFYGFIWKDASGPAQDNDDPNPQTITYSKLMDQYFSPAVYRWDDQALAPYLSIDASMSAQKMFITYDDERLVMDKVLYARDKGLGGLMIWELGQGYRRNQPLGQRNPLLDTVKLAYAASSATNTPKPL